MELVLQNSNMNKIIIEAIPKKCHGKSGGNSFRGSKYRGVSRNKNKWQVSKHFLFSLSHLFLTFLYSIDDDHA
jgi:hypothetical protein